MLKTHSLTIENLYFIFGNLLMYLAILTVSVTRIGNSQSFLKDSNLIKHS